MTARPKLLYVITKSDIGGAQGNVLDLIRVFAPLYDVSLLVGKLGPLADDVESLGIPVYQLPSLIRQINPLQDIQCIRDCIKLIRTLKPDVIHAHSSKAGVVARVAGRICGVPTVFTAHGWGFSPGTPRLRRVVALWTERLLGRISTKIICVSESDRQQALKKGIASKQTLATVRCGISNSTVPVSQPGIQPPRLIMVARFNEQKDQATLLKAIAQLNDLNFHVDFVGSGPSLENCKKLAESLNVQTKVSFLGDRRDVPDLLYRSQIFILSTHYEGLPISILEAMRHGLPVIGSAVNGIPEEVSHYETGIVVPPRDVKALANALSELIKSPTMRQEMGAASKRKFEQEFTIAHMAKQVEQIYSDILGDKQNFDTSSSRTVQTIPL